MVGQMRSKSFLRSSEGATTNYNYEDFAEGTGIVVFYAGGMAESGAVIYRLDKNVFSATHSGYSGVSSGTFASNREIRLETAQTSFTQLADIDIDTTPLNLPRTVDGTMLCNIAYGTSAGTSSIAPEMYVVVTFRKLDANSIETDIASGTSEIGKIAAGIAITQGMFSFPIDIPRTLFKRGDTIRVNILVYARDASGTGTAGFIIGLDPDGNELPDPDAAGTAKERLTIDAGYSTTKFFIPFRIDV